MARRPAQFDTLLRIRQIQQDLRAHEFAEARRAVDAAEQQREALVLERSTLFEEAGNRARDQFDAAEVRSFYQFERHLMHLIDNQDAELQRLEAVAEQRRQELEAAMKRRKMVEMLRNRKMDAYRNEILKEEQKLSDEKATNSAAVARMNSR